MDLSNLLPVGQPLVIKLPDGTETDVVFDVVGQDSQQFRAVSRRVGNAMLGKEDKATMELLEAQGAELAAAYIVGWRGLTQAGEPLPYSPQEALKLMLNPGATHIRNQVEEFARVRTNFFPRGKATAGPVGTPVVEAEHA